MKNLKIQLGVPQSNLTIRITAIIAIIAVGFIIYTHTLNSGFHFDDEGTITNSHMIRSLKKVFLKYNERPVLTLTYALNYFFGKLNSFGYHLVDLIIHILCGILVFFISELTLKLPILSARFHQRAERIALFSALIFVAHPIRIESVSYISSRSATLATFFYLLALFFFILSVYQVRSKTIYHILTVICAVLAIGSKEIAATLPITILLYDFMFISNTDLSELKKRRKFYIFLFSTLSFSAYLIIAGHHTGLYGKTAGFGMPFVSPINYLFTEFTVVLYYVKLFLIPANFNLDYDWRYANGLFEFPTFSSFLILLGIFILTIKVFRRKPLYLFLIIWYFLTLVPESTIIPLKDAIFEHRTYLPSFGLILLFVISIDNSWERIKGTVLFFNKKKNAGKIEPSPFLLTIFFACLVFILSWLSIKRGNIWLSEISLWEDTVKRSPNKARAHMNLGVAYKTAKYLDKATFEFKESFRIDPTYARGQSNLGVIYFEAGKLDEAQKELEEAIKKCNGLPEIHNNLGIVYKLKGMLYEAIQSFKRAILLDPEYANAYYNLGEIYIASDRIEEAIGVYSKAVAITPEAAGVHANLGALYSKKGMFLKAEKELKEAIRLNPKDFQSHYNLGVNNEKMGRIKEAIAEYRIARDIKPDCFEARYALAGICKELGLFDEAVKEYQGLVTINPLNGPNMANLLFTKMRKSKWDEAFEVFKKAIEANPGDESAYVNLGKACVNLGIYKKAKSVFDELLKINPRSFEAHLNLGIIYGNNAEGEMAIEEFKKAIEINPRDSRAHYNLGVAYESKSLNALAIKEYRETVKYQPDHKRAYLNLGVLLAQENQIDEAIKIFKQLINIAPDFAEGYLNLGGLYRKKGELRTAEEKLKKALQLKPEYALAHFNLALIYAQQGKKEEIKNEYDILKNIDVKLAEALEKFLN